MGKLIASDFGTGIGRADPCLWTIKDFSGAGVGFGNALSHHTAHKWNIEGKKDKKFYGFSQYRPVYDNRVVMFGGKYGFYGERNWREINSTTRQDLSIVYASKGDMRLSIGDRTVNLKQGMFTLTDSMRPMTLEVGDDFRQLDLIFPKSSVLSLSPFAGEFVGIEFGRGEGLLSFFIDHLNTLENYLGVLEEGNASKVLTTTLDMLAMTLTSLDPMRLPSPRQRTMQRIKAYIDNRLADPDLSIDDIAQSNNVNVRYLQKLFSDQGISIGAWIRKRRLEMCARDFCAPVLSERNLTEIAFRWGFNDMSHFSKIFKREYGMSPRKYREQANQR